jgi:hypothetical protein
MLIDPPIPGFIDIKQGISNGNPEKSYYPCYYNNLC